MYGEEGVKGRKRKKGGVRAEEERKVEKRKEEEKKERTQRGKVASFSHVQHCVYV